MRRLMRTRKVGIVDVCIGQSERSNTSTSCHFMFTHLPMHGFCSTPWNCQFFGDSRPHVGFESEGDVSVKIQVRQIDHGATFHTRLNIPLIQPSKFVLAILIPFTSSFKIILIVKTTTDCGTTRK